MRETSLAHQKDQERPTVGRNPAITTWHVWNPVNNGDIHHTNWLAGFLNHQQQDYVKILLEPLSLLVLEGPSRLNFTHAIRQSSLGIDFFQFHAVFLLSVSVMESWSLGYDATLGRSLEEHSLRQWPWKFQVFKSGPTYLGEIMMWSFAWWPHLCISGQEVGGRYNNELWFHIHNMLIL